MGYGFAADLADRGLCPFCRLPVDMDALDTEEARTEYDTTGMCRVCFDMFGNRVLERWNSLTHEQQESIVLDIIDRSIKK